MIFALGGKTNLGDLMKKAIRIFDLILGVICTVLFAFIIYASAVLPDNVIVYGNDYSPFSKVITYSSKSLKGYVSVDSQTAEPVKEDLKLLGVVPIKQVSVTAKSVQSVDVSGEVFGIKLYTDGVIVVGIQSVETDGGKRTPASEAGIEAGDIIVAIDGVKVYTSNEVQAILNNNNGNDFDIQIKRGDRYRNYTLTPVYSQREGCYKAGMWVRDSTAGIGTMTFYDEQSGKFGALGHQINDVDTNELMPLLEGEAVQARVTGVERSSKGTAGSLECEFTSKSLGRLVANTECGIFGEYNSISEYAKPYPVASAQQVKRGRATMLSTVDGAICEYEVEITHISYSESSMEKNIVLKITDESLLEKTGGIVQGMSGSPIIQNGRLVGALTHVIVNNPEKGYAVFAQTMLEQCEKQ